MSSNTASPPPGKRRLLDFEGNSGNHQFPSSLEHINKENIPNGCEHKAKKERLTVEKRPFGQAYLDAQKMSCGTPYADSFPHSCTISGLMFAKASSGTACDPLLNETSLSSSLGDRYQPNEYHDFSSSARNLYGNSVNLPKFVDSCPGDGKFLLDYGFSTSEFTGMPTSSSTTLKMNSSVSESDMVTISRLPYPCSNVRPKSLQVSEGHSQLHNRHALLNVPEQANCMRYSPFKRETEAPWNSYNTRYGNSNPFQFYRKEGYLLGKEHSSLYQQDGFLNAPITMSNRSRIWYPLPQTKKNGIQSPLPKVDLHNKLAGNSESKTMRKVVKLQRFLYLCKHTLCCFEGCNLIDCKLMKQILSHCLNCHDNLCEQMCSPYKKLLLHYEKCCKTDCPICPSAKIRFGNLCKLKYGSTEVKTTTITSDCDHSSVEVKIKSHNTSPCTSCASEVTDIEHASLFSQAHVSKSREEKALNSLSKCINETFSDVNNGKISEAVFENPNSVSSVLLEAKCDSSGKVVVEGECQNLQPLSSLSRKEVVFEELTSIECIYPSSNQAILESQDLIKSKDFVDGMKLEERPIGSRDYTGSAVGMASHVPHPQHKALEASINSVVQDMKGENNCAESILDPRKLKIKPKIGEAMREVNHGTPFSFTGSMPGNEPKRTISLLNLLTPEGVRVHIRSLRQSINLDKTTTEKMSRLETQKRKSCSLCGMDKLRFRPPLRYCSACTKQISPRGIFYFMKDFSNSASASGVLNIFCNSCYTLSRENIKFAKQSIPKLHLEQRANYAETDAISEELVQCDKCKNWLHEICALFNGKLNKDKSAQIEYTCPTCCLNEIENGIYDPLLNYVVTGAKKLPRTKLSDHIEQWIFRRLEEERHERAKSLGKKVNEVSTVDDLVVRVVLSVDTCFEVKSCIREIFHEEKYPFELTYKSKAVVLFQVIDGADVLLFAMYVQEYSSKCSEPSRRYVCISYIDSAKYFKPEIRAVSGEALRTFVYHELLIGYFDYCKRRGFTNCYIWACPPSKDDDYILYCHPRTQKIPKSDKLREWYQKMIRKGSKRGIIMESTNLYDHFFIQTSESKGKITAARLPYFDRDYWPGVAETLLQSYNGGNPQKKAKKAKAVIERALRAARRDASLIENEMDVLLMNNLGDIIRPIKEDFIILFLHHICKHCCQPITSEGLFVCNMCKNFQLCERCYNIEGELQYKDRHPVNSRDKHSFYRVESENVPKNTIDEDETKQCEIFNTRLEFLNFCQGNHYQFDTLRRAKHSTMMILDHLYNPNPTVFEYSRGKQMDNNQRDLSYHEEHSTRHRSLLNTTFRSQKPLLMDSLSHASKCGDRSCTYPHCRRLKVVFHHGSTCSIRQKGGCEICAKMWHLIFMHASSCAESECNVPRCNDMKRSFAHRLPASIQRTEGGIKQPSAKVFVGSS